MTPFVDTNVIIRHLTGDPAGQAKRATTFLAEAEDLLLADLVVAEIVYVLESYYAVPRSRVAELLRSVITFEAIRGVDPPALLRALEIYEVHNIDFADAYLAAMAEVSGVGSITSFDKAIDRVATVRQIEP